MAEKEKGQRSPEGNWPKWWNKLWDRAIYKITPVMPVDTAPIDTKQAS